MQAGDARQNKSAKKQLWQRFIASGRIEDYIEYKRARQWEGTQGEPAADEE